MRNPKETQVGKMGDAEELLRHIEDKLEISNQKSILRDIFYCKLANIYCFKNCRHGAKK